jgi:hypothetical protein
VIGSQMVVVHVTTYDAHLTGQGTVVAMIG